MRAETRLSGRARARVGEGQHPLQGGWLPRLTIRWSELSPARGFATCGMGTRSARSAAIRDVNPSAEMHIHTGRKASGQAITGLQGRPVLGYDFALDPFCNALTRGLAVRDR